MSKHPNHGRLLASPRLILTRRQLLTGVGSSAAFFGLGLINPADALTLRAARYRPPPVGSVWEYTETSGRVERVERIENGAWLSWNVVRTIREVEDEELHVRSYNIISGNWMVSFDAERGPIYAADPDDRRFRWPISAGGFWRSEYMFRDYRNDRRFKTKVAWSVLGFELVDTPFGVQRTIRMRSKGKKTATEIWFAFDMGLRLRETKYDGSKMIADKWLSAVDRAPDGGREPRLPPWEEGEAKES